MVPGSAVHPWYLLQMQETQLCCTSQWYSGKFPIHQYILLHEELITYKDTVPLTNLGALELLSLKREHRLCIVQPAKILGSHSHCLEVLGVNAELTSERNAAPEVQYSNPEPNQHAHWGCSDDGETYSYSYFLPFHNPTFFQVVRHTWSYLIEVRAERFRHLVCWHLPDSVKTRRCGHCAQVGSMQYQLVNE